MRVSVRQIQKLDKIAIETYGVPSLALMENAGRAVSAEVLKALRGRRNVCVICGLGNNAGDGFVLARHLINAGCNVSIVLIGRGTQLKEDAAVNYHILKKLKHPILEMKQVSDRVIGALKKSDIVVDAIFGVGLNRAVGSPFKEFIEAINHCSRRVIAVDTPSGLDATDGDIYAVCVKADKTVTFTFSKKGFTKRQGPKHVGKVVVVDIGIPRQLQKRLR
jgi:NAD(P)H-hydrate epimerase